MAKDESAAAAAWSTAAAPRSSRRIAEVTFYGTDQAGNDVTVTGTISVTFADFGDPELGRKGLEP